MFHNVRDRNSSTYHIYYSIILVLSFHDILNIVNVHFKKMFEFMATNKLTLRF